MKRITTVIMQPEKKFMLMGNVLGSIGNDHIRGHHIAFFENKLIEANEYKHSDISTAPYYYAWLFLMSDHIFWEMRKFCFSQNGFEHDDLALMYNELITKFCDTCRKIVSFSEIEIEDLFVKAVKLLEIRHALIHKGFPNLLPIALEDKYVRNKPSLRQGESKNKFTEESTKEAINWFSNPKNFYKIKDEFYCLIKAMGKGSGFSIGF